LRFSSGERDAWKPLFRLAQRPQVFLPLDRCGALSP
jgi:hypothetical protein